MDWLIRCILWCLVIMFITACWLVPEHTPRPPSHREAILRGMMYTPEIDRLLPPDWLGKWIIRELVYHQLEKDIESPRSKDT